MISIEACDFLVLNYDPESTAKLLVVSWLMRGPSDFCPASLPVRGGTRNGYIAKGRMGKSPKESCASTDSPRLTVLQFMIFLKTLLTMA